MTSIAGKAVLITGANRGIGQALVEAALAREASRVYAGTRAPFTHSDTRVVPVTLDVTSDEQIRAAVDAVGSLDLLINNAGIAGYDDLSDAEVIARHLAVNLYGTHAVTRAFTPLLARSGGAVVNNLSITAFAPLPLIPSYSISKAAALALTQASRTLLEPRGVRVHAVLTGFVDTDMTRGAQSPKATPASVAEAIFDGVEQGRDDIFPDAMSRPMADGWRALASSVLEGRFAALAAELRAAA
ncbi:SDR family NAD(P)-dependent oxidoreductase [Asanoa sp. NPDC049573]|uniref:SDR family NAD(P)-dependent oxidoreductase n=1 Tax=Asanoa sp. NPDC049573 TaxID=3155396 RepID=UPI0034155C06